MSDRIAIVNKGRIEQLGTADEIYHRPRTQFVAEFIGEANLVPAQVIAREGGCAIVRVGDGITLRMDGANLPADTQRVLVSVRPEKIFLTKNEAGGENGFAGEVVGEVFRGQTDQLTIRTKSGLEFSVVVANESRSEACFHKGDKVFCRLHPEDIVVVQEG